MRLLLSFAALLVASGCGPSTSAPAPAPLTVMTYNVMCSFCAETGMDDWATRLPHLEAAITRHKPDLLGLEELLTQDDLDPFLASFPEYTAVYFVDPDPGNDKAPFPIYPDATIFFRTSRFTEVNHGSYWLSPTPDTPWSEGFAPHVQLWRLVTWVELVDKPSGQHLFFAATHFDNNAPSQAKSAPLVLARTAPWAKKMPVIFVGDFNSTPATTAYATLATAFKNSYDLATTPRIDTDQSPAPEWDPTQRIDHIWTAGHAFHVTDWAVDIHLYGEPPRPPSDHFPVVAQLAW